MSNPPNPNGANQFNLDPRQKLCWDFYIDPRSETFGNAKKSALKAGYEETSADQITTAEWFIGKTRRMNIRNKAEKVLEEMLDMPVETVKLSRTKQVDEDGEPEEVVTQAVVTDPALVKIKQDTAKFAAERLGKDEWSSRNELSGPNGSDLVPVDQALKDRAKKAIDEYLNANNVGGKPIGEEGAVSV